MNNGIAYQNKDIISKTFIETFGSKSLEVYGIHVPKVVRLLPTNLPAVEANELRIDNLLELEDGSVAILDYESSYNEKDKAKYMNYMARVYRHYATEGKPDVDIRMIVIYTADVKPENVKTQVQKAGFSVTIEPAYLSKLNAEEIEKRLSGKVKKGEPLMDEELMEFIILPLTYRSKERKQQSIKESIELAKQVRNEKQSNFIIAGIVVFADKIIDTETRENAKGWIKMTTIGRMFEQEKEDAVRVAEARMIVDDVERVSKGFAISVEEVCEKMGIDAVKYEAAKKLVAETLVGVA
ncbi:MAG: hypothetical protein IJ682_12660 [Lachnospiraceae bacterium]|nr:hypothetical protein [Lachnospiraceae bacterium]